MDNTATFLIELDATNGESEHLTERARELLAREGALVVETSFAASLRRSYVVAEAAPSREQELGALLRQAQLPVLELARVRVVGTPASEDGPTPSHLVEWDLPKSLGMDQYLKRKAEKTPLYAQAPDVKFLRTYVREDMAKCVCLYEAPDEEAVRRAREIVSAPVDRLARLERNGRGELDDG